MISRVKIFSLLMLVAVVPLSAQGTGDHKGVKDAVLDYVEAIYEVQPERITKSVHPSLNKQGYMSRDGENYQGPAMMNFEQLKSLAGSWNEGNRNADPATAKKLVEVYDVQDKTAIAKLTASWGTDYFLLAKLEGKWMIMQVLWQTPMSPES